MGNMGSAHPLVEVNVSFKLEGNPSISKGVIERTRIGDRRMDGRTDGRTDGTKRIQYSPPHTLCCGGIKMMVNGYNLLGYITQDTRLISRCNVDRSPHNFEGAFTLGKVLNGDQR